MLSSLLTVFPRLVFLVVEVLRAYCTRLPAPCRGASHCGSSSGGRAAGAGAAGGGWRRRAAEHRRCCGSSQGPLSGQESTAWEVGGGAACKISSHRSISSSSDMC